ncbi:MAG: hypothetical protein ACP5PV_11935 [Methanothrix sp.]
MKLRIAVLLIASILIFSGSALGDLKIYDDGKEPFYWTGYLGDESRSSLEINSNHGGGDEGSQSGEQCAQVIYHEGAPDAEFYIQVREGDWNTGPNIGLNLGGEEVLSFWARGEGSGETVTFGYGYGADPQTGYSDSARDSSEVKLTNYWKEYQFDLRGKDLSHINGPFFFKIKRSDHPVGATFYIDNISYTTPNGIEPTDLEIILENPQNNEPVSSTAYVSGMLSRNLNEDEFLWIAVKPVKSFKNWWPQNQDGVPLLESGTNEFAGVAHLSGTKDDRFEIRVLAVNKETNELFEDYIETCIERGDWPPITEGIPGTNIQVSKEVIEAFCHQKANVILNQ